MGLKTAPPEGVPPSLKFCTDALPPQERAAVWRELYGRSILRLEIEPLSDGPFSSELAISMLPDLGLVRGRASPFRVGRTKELLTDGDDGLILQITDVPGRAAQLGRDIDVNPNDAVLLSSAEIGSFAFSADCNVGRCGCAALPLPRWSAIWMPRWSGRYRVRTKPCGC